MDLLPCPLCGHTPSLVIEEGQLEGMTAVYHALIECPRCRLAWQSLWEKTAAIAEAAACAAWNRRTPPPESDKPGIAAIMGQWPGDESDEEVKRALEEMS